MLRNMGWKPGDAGQVVVRIGGDSLAECQTPQAKQMASEEARQHTSPPVGMSGTEGQGYIPKGKTEPLTDAEALVPGKIVKGKGTWFVDYRFQGRTD